MINGVKTAELQSGLIELLRRRIRLANGQQLYGVIDGATDLELVYEAMTTFGYDTVRSLFQGDMAEAMSDVAPYVVPIDPASDYLEKWVQRFDTHAGILVTTSMDLDELHVHLRQIFVTQDETDQDYFLRFYDPRVLPDFLDTCTPEQIDEFFGPITAFVVDNADIAGYTRYTCDRDGNLAAQPLRPVTPSGETL